MTKVVQLSDEAYARLRSLKREDESFSDAVIRLSGARGDLTALRGLRTAREIRLAEKLIRHADALDRA